MLYLGTLNKQLSICQVDPRGNPLPGQNGCYHLIPVFDWIKHCIISIFLVFFIAFLPLFMQGMLLYICHGYRQTNLCVHRTA